MLTTFNDIRTEVINRLGIETTAAFYTDTLLNQWIRGANRWATSYKKWPHTEGRLSTTWAGSEELLFEGYKADSFRFMQIGGKRLQKLSFDDYQIFREQTPAAADRVFSDFGRLVYINPNVDLSGTLTAYGQYVPVDIDVTDLASETVFSGRDEEGNEAIVLEVISYAKTKKQLDKEALVYHKSATDLLDALWKKIQDEQFAYQTHRTRGGMFKRIDVLNNRTEDDGVRRDQFLF